MRQFSSKCDICLCGDFNTCTNNRLEIFEYNNVEGEMFYNNYEEHNLKNILHSQKCL